MKEKMRETDKLDPVWKALADPTRRAILDLLRDKPRTTTEIVEQFPHLTRFGVMKHLDGLRDAGLVNTREEGRQRWNSLDVFPIRQIYERWVSPYQEMWASQLLGIKLLAEDQLTDEASGEGAGDGTGRSARVKDAQAHVPHPSPKAGAKVGHPADTRRKRTRKKSPNNNS